MSVANWGDSDAVIISFEWSYYPYNNNPFTGTSIVPANKQYLYDFIVYTIIYL